MNGINLFQKSHVKEFAQLFLWVFILINIQYLGDIIIERWLPYGPLPEREIIRRPITCYGDVAKPTCTIIKYDNPQPRISQKFVVVEVYNADPKDYAVRYSGSLLSPSELVLEARHVGIREDIVKCFQRYYKDVTVFFLYSRLIHYQYLLICVSKEKVLTTCNQETVTVIVFQQKMIAR